MNNKIKVNIAGSVYTIIGEKSKDEVEAIANFVDEEIKKITSQNYLLNSTMAATFLISPSIPRISKSASTGKPKRWLYCLAVRQY